MQNELSMKKIARILVVIAMIAGCGEARHPLLKEAKDIVHQRPDSARVIISKVDTASLSEADRMEYRLLKIMTDYIVLHQADGDSLITTCVNYYDKHGDAWHRGRAYYYRAGIRRHLLDRTFDGIKDYKIAETIAEDADDELLKNMVYENLAFANYNCFTHPLILEYSQKFLLSSLKLNDSVMTLRGLQMCASAYAYMDQNDSAYACIFRSMDYIDLADSILRADIYHNIAAMYQEQGDDENARKYLKKWKNDKATSSFKGYLVEARLLEAQGHYEEAIESVKKSLTEKDPLVRNHSMEVLSKLYEKIGDMSAALDMKRQKDVFTDSVMKANHSLEIADWQRKFDEARWEERSHRQMMKAGIAFLSFLFVLTMGIWWYWRRVRSLRFRLDEHARRITEKQAEIGRLQQSGEANEQTIAELNKQIEANRQRISNKLLVGTRCFVKLQEMESASDMTAEERQCLIDYFAQLRPKRWQEWERTYSSLTPSQYVFLILQDDLHYDDDTIAHILDVKPASLRTLRSRIKGRER
jgi:tetratricopeptide (TPR) repeat protein